VGRKRRRVVGSTMYVVSPYPNILYALDLTKPGAPLKVAVQCSARSCRSGGVACCDVVNRGPTYANRRVFFTTLNTQVVAVDAEIGNEVWKKERPSQWLPSS